MEPLLPSSPFFIRLLAEHPWTLVGPLLVVGAVLAWWGARNDRAKVILGGIGVLLVAAGVLVTSALWRSPGEEAAEAVRDLVACAERADVSGVTGRFASDASMHFGSVTAPGEEMTSILRAAETLNGRNQIQDNAITQLDFATVDSNRAQVILGCRTTTNASYGPVPTLWWMELVRQPNGMWRIQRLAFLRVGTQAASRSFL